MLPVMLCAIPCIHICCGGKKKDSQAADEFERVEEDMEEEEERLLLRTDAYSETNSNKEFRDMEDVLKQLAPREEEVETGELFIHQIIETIEFVLGCISNTASYLRLWALSLAHGQLGETFLTILLTNPYVVPSTFSTPVAIVYFFIASFPFMFAILTVLLMMDSLEVFLHTMRLHWVEFMSKFYQG